MKSRASLLLAGTAALLALSATAALAKEYYIGEPQVMNNMQLVPNYLLGITMDPMPAGMAMGTKDTVHLEVDVHATKGETHGFHEDEWIPYLTIHYTLKQAGGYKVSGILSPMVAGDGPHYANNVQMNGPGEYTLTYHFEPPSKLGFARHTDKETGVPAWWAPFDASWTFQYPSKSK